MLFPRLGAFVPRLDLPISVSLPIIYLTCLTPILALLYLELSSRRARAREPKGCRKLGLRNFSNLQDEFEYGTNGRKRVAAAKRDGKIRIKALVAYPIKSCAGVEFNIADVVETGMAYDRQFCFAEFIEDAAENTNTEEKTEYEGKTGRWVMRTLRDGKFSKLALIRPEIWIPDPSSPTYSPKRRSVASGGVLVINYPRVLLTGGSSISRLATSILMKLNLVPREESFHIPLNPAPGHDYPSRPLRIWKDTPTSLDYGEHLPPSFRDFLASATGGKNVTLFRVDPEHTRSVFRCAPRKETLGFQPITGFADAYPIHMLSIGSVRDIAERSSYAIPKLSSRRFRANIILEGVEKYEEDHWKEISILLGSSPLFQSRNEQGKKTKEAEEVKVYTSCRTVRCRLPNVDPDTGVRHTAEPDKTLKSFRCIDPGDTKNACLGMQLVPGVQNFTLRVGDEVRVLATGEHFYIKQ